VDSDGDENGKSDGDGNGKNNSERGSVPEGLWDFK
jgi:hypothetical protein